MAKQARKLEIPKSNYQRVYRVCIRGSIDKNDISKLNQGIKINKISYKKIQARIEKNHQKILENQKKD